MVRPLVGILQQPSQWWKERGTVRSGARQRWVGLDIGSQSIKAAELEQVGSGLRLVKVLVQELLVSDDGQPIDRLGWLQSALKEFSTDELYVSLSGPNVAVRRIRLPLMSANELAEAAKWEVKEQLPFPVQEAVLDFIVIGEVWEKDIKKQDVLVAAASKVLVQESIALVERAGGRVAGIAPADFAAWRCVAALVPEAGKNPLAVIEIGGTKSSVTIAKDGHVRLVRELAVGSASMTQSLVGVMTSDKGEITIDRSRAEALKRRYGVLDETPEGETKDGVPLFHLASLMRPVLEHLLTELSRVLVFYRTQIDEAGISRVLVCGAGANLKQLQPFLASGLGVTVETFNPLIRITDRLQHLDPDYVSEAGPRLTVALGLAVDHGQTLNLLPSVHRPAVDSTQSSRVWWAAAKAIVAVAIIAYLGLQGFSIAVGWQTRQRQQLWQMLEPAYGQDMGAISTRIHLEQTVGDLERFIEQQPVWDGVFKDLIRVIPPSIELDELTVFYSDDEQLLPKIQLRGHVISRNDAGEGTVAKFMEQLGHSVFFDHIELASSEMHSSNTGETQFTIEGMLQ